MDLKSSFELFVRNENFSVSACCSAAPERRANSRAMAKRDIQPVSNAVAKFKAEANQWRIARLGSRLWQRKIIVPQIIETYRNEVRSDRR
jgi:inorganic pyrophosphatase/exopolyphosphatase